MGNRQGGKLANRPDLSYQQRAKKQPAKALDGSVVVDLLSPHLHPAAFQSIAIHAPGIRGTSQSAALRSHVADGSAVDGDGNLNFVSKIFQEERHTTSCLPDNSVSADTRSCLSVAEGGETSASHCSQTASRSPTAFRRKVLQSSSVPSHQHMVKKQFTVPQVCTEASSTVLFPRPCCLATDSGTRVGGRVISSAAVSCTDCTAADCMDTLEKLKRNIEHSHTENLTHFNNAGFAQLQSETDFDDYDNAVCSKEPETCTHRRSKSMSPKSAVCVGVPRPDKRNESKVVRKLSEPSRFVYRTEGASSKSVIPGVWSKSAENSPVIVRKALPNPGSPVIVQRTPSQSPSVERRFPANAPPGAVLSEYCAEALDSAKSRPLVYQKVASKNQDCPEAKETSHSIRQKVTAEISIPHVSTAPVSVRKPPESPVLFSSSVHLQEEMKEREKPSKRTTGGHSVPASIPLDTSKLYHMRALTSSSSCSSSPSESVQGKLPLQEDSAPPFIPPCTSSTSTFSATLGTSSPTPIQFCPQPKGTPVRTCTMASQPSTAVVLDSRESQGSLLAMDTRTQPAEDTEETGGTTTSVQRSECQSARDSPTPAQSQPSGSAVTEDTIKQNSQSAVFGSVSPKLLRHRRLVKENSSSSRNQHTFPKQSHSIQITTAKTYPRNGESTVSGTGDTVHSGHYKHMHMTYDDNPAHLSHSAPSSFSLHGASANNARAGNKTLGQRIREVINETAVELTSGKGTSLFGKHEKVFSKDDIFTNTSTHEKSILYSFSNHSRKENETFSVSVKPLPDRKVNQAGLVEDNLGVRAEYELRIKPPLSPAGVRDTLRDTRLLKSTGYSYHLSSSRDSCSSCISDSSQPDCYETSSFAREGGCQHPEVFTDGGHSKQGVLLARHLGVPGQRLVTSDTSDTLSTDRDTSSSSKRESSTSTATDDTLTSFKTRSTTGSAEYDEGFILPASLVFIRSADKDGQHEVCAFESEQTTIKRKLVQRHLPESRAEHEPLSHKTRKKRRKQHLQPQTITARRERAESPVKRNRAVRDVYSDEISEDSDPFGSKDDISDFPSSRDDISDLPSSRDDISDLPSSRDDISDIHSSRDDIPDVSDGKPAPNRFSRPRNFPDDGAIKRQVFHRSDLHSSKAPTHSRGFESRAVASELTARCHVVAELSDNKVTSAHNRGRSSSQESSETCPDVCEMTGDVGDPGTVPPDPHAQILASGKRPGPPHPDVPLPAGSPSFRPRKRLTGTSPLRSKQPDGTGERERYRELGDTRAYPVYTDDDDEGKELLLQRPESLANEDTVVLSCTIYNSAMSER